MTGFIKGLFRGNKGEANQAEANQAEANQAEANQDQADQSEGAFFLSADEAKSFGNIEYMRSSKTIKRTFARKKGQEEELESIRSVSALGSVEVTEEGKPVAAPEPPPVSVAEEVKPEIKEVQTARKQADSSLDMFRNMARDIRR